MDIQQLKYFMAIAEHKNYSHAAKELFVTQPILTRCIKNLESELEVQLIERTSKNFRLTDAGETLYVHGASLLDQYQDLYRRINDTKNLKNGNVHISSPGVLLDMYFPSILTDFRTQNPGINISLIEEGSKKTAQSVLQGEVDIGIVMLPVANQYEMDVYPLLQDEVRLLARRDHPLANLAEVRIEQLEDVEIITYNSNATLYDAFVKLCMNHGFMPHIVYKSLMPLFIMETIALGSCIGVLPYPMIRRYEEDSLTSIRIIPNFPWEIAAILKKGRYRSYATQKLLEHIIHAFHT